MKIFIDISEFDLGKAFSFWDTEERRFVIFRGRNAWNTWDSFVNDYVNHPTMGLEPKREIDKALDEYRNIIKPWVIYQNMHNTVKAKPLFEPYFYVKCEHNSKGQIDDQRIYATSSSEVRSKYLEAKAIHLLRYMIRKDIWTLCFTVTHMGRNIVLFNIDLKSVLTAACSNLGFVRKES